MGRLQQDEAVKLKPTNSSKKGQLGGIQNGFLALMFMAVAIIVVVVIAAFGSDYTDSQRVDFCTGTRISFDDDSCWSCSADFPTYNTTGNDCNNATGGSEARSVYSTPAYNVTVQGLENYNTLATGTSDVTDVGIITIVLGLLVALIGVFGYAGYNRIKQ